jgi:hypothetical protein
MALVTLAATSAISYAACARAFAGQPPQGTPPPARSYQAAATGPARSAIARESPSDSTVFSEGLDGKTAEALAADRSVDAGQRNEALNALRERDRPAAIRLLVNIIKDERESVTFRSWAGQHLGMIGEGATPAELGAVVPALVEGLSQPFDSPIWRECLFALSGIPDASAVSPALRELGRLSPSQVKEMGPLHGDLVRKLGSNPAGVL